jgi:hypothetical protein
VLVAAIVAVGFIAFSGRHTSSETGGRVRRSHEKPVGRGQTFSTADGWYGKVAGKEYSVYAGASESPPGSGKAGRSELLVFAFPSRSGPPVPDGTYNPPGDGREPLEVISSHGAVLKLQTRPGTYLYFDLAHRVFVRG